MFDDLLQSIGRPTLVLGGSGLLVAALLSSGNLVTAPAIQARQAEDLLDSLGQVMPGALFDNDLLADALAVTVEGIPVTVYRGTRNGAVTALAWQSAGEGYAGPIRLVMAVDPTGKVLGVRVLSHSETPGLGDKIEERKDDWILSFDGLSLADQGWAVEKDGGRFDQFTGATITPRAVVNTVHRGLEFFRDHQGQLLTAPPVPPQVQEARP